MAESIPENQRSMMVLLEVLRNTSAIRVEKESYSCLCYQWDYSNIYYSNYVKEGNNTYPKPGAFPVVVKYTGQKKDRQP